MDKSINLYQILSFLAIIIFISACLDEYNPPEIINSKSVLVVEGNISDTETAIRLTQTTNLSDDVLIPVDNALVRIENEDGSFRFELSSESEGFYNAIVPLAENDKYRIRIQT